MLIRLIDGRLEAAQDAFVGLEADEPAPHEAAVIVSLARFQTDGDAWLAAGRRVGVRLQPDEPVEGLAYDLPRLSLVALAFPKFRDGRAYSSAVLLRGRYRFAGEVRAVGEVQRDQAYMMVRCGFDAFAPLDGATAEDWAHAARRFRHVYQAAADRRVPAFEEREAASAARDL